MIEFLIFSSGIYLKYITFFIYFLLAGRAQIILLSKFIYGSYSIPETILELKSHLTYPIFGMIFVGNFLVLLNYISLYEHTIKTFCLIIISKYW